MKSCSVLFILAAQASAFVPQKLTSARQSTSVGIRLTPEEFFEQRELFEDDEDMIPVAEAYIHAKYKQVAASHGHSVATKDDVREVLHSILPPVTPEELKKEEELILKDLLRHERSSPDSIDEDDFVKRILKNSYWRDAGDIVVKELMYFDSLHCYYKTGKPLLNNADYDELHENLTWEGSSVATMSKKEVEFVSAVAASKRGESLINDEEYESLKEELKEKGSWVVNRGEDALEKLGENTFLSYLHRAMS
jgi:hypothetical protein